MADQNPAIRADQPTIGRRSRPLPFGTRRLVPVLVAVLLGLHAVLGWLSREPGILTGQDDVEYIVLGQALRRGDYRLDFQVDAPVHATYPPVYPALLGLWGAASGDDWDALVALNVLLSVAGLLVAYAAVRRRLGLATAMLGLAVCAVNPWLVGFAGGIRSEVPFVLFSMLALWSVAGAAAPAVDQPLGEAANEPRATGAEAGGYARTSHLVAGAAAAIIAALTRSVGITLVGALGLYWLLGRRWKTAAWFALASALTVGAWLLWTVLAPEQYVGSSYSAELRAIDRGGFGMPPLPRRMIEHIAYYVVRALPSALATPSVAGTPLDNAVSLSVLGAAGVSGLAVLWRRWRAAFIYLIAYAALLVVWLWRVDRFLVPLIPLLVPTLLAGAAWIAGRWNRRAALPAAAAIALILTAGGMSRSVARARDAMACDRSGPLPPPACLRSDQASYFEAVRYVRDELPADAVLLAAKPGALYWYTGRRSISYAVGKAQDSASFLPYVRQHGADHILLGSLEILELSQLAPLVEANCTGLALEAAFPPRTYLFRVLAADRPESAAEACAAASAHRLANVDRDFWLDR